MEEHNCGLSLGLSVLPWAAGIALAAAMAVPEGVMVGLTAAFLGAGAAVAAAVSLWRGRREPAPEQPAPIPEAEPGVALPQLLRQALKATGARRAALLIKDETGGMQVTAQVAEGSSTDPIPGDDPLGRRSVMTASPCLANGEVEAGQGGASAPLRCQSLPGSTDGEVLGALVVREKARGSFTESDLAVIESVASQASMHLVSKTLYSQLYDSFRGTMHSLAAALEARDPYTRGHCNRLSQLARMIAERMELDKDTMQILQDAALLHDIGKISLPDSILHKQGALTPEEWEAVRAYPMASEEICRPLRLRPETLFLIRHHQERLDGSGYPDGLKEDEQPLPLRILAVAEAFDAMSSERPYRQALDTGERLNQLDQHAGVKFDRRVVDALKALVSEAALSPLYPPP